MNSLILKYKSSLEELCRSLHVKQLYVFGSGAGDSLGKDSDLDFLLSFNDGLSAEEYADNYFLLHQKLEQLFNRKIDLITERSLSNPNFIDSINSTKSLSMMKNNKKYLFDIKVALNQLKSTLKILVTLKPISKTNSFEELLKEKLKSSEKQPTKF